MSKWNTTKLLVIGGLAALNAVFNILGAIVSAATILGAGGLINAFFGGIFFVFCCLLIRKFGAAIIMGFVFSICVLPLPVLGPSGFLVKIIIGILTGLVVDIIYVLLKRNEMFASIGIGIGLCIIINIGVIGFGLLFSVPGIKEAVKLSLFPLALVVFPLIGGVGGYVGYLAFKRLKNTSIVKRIQI